MVLEFLKELTHAGYRVFSVKESKQIAEGLGLKSSSVPYLLRSLASRKLIRPLFKGNYIIEDNILAGPPLHKFEIAMHLAEGGAIVCWSAMSYYELTDQVFSKIYVLAPYVEDKKRSLYRYKINGYDYLLIQIQKKNFWGIEKIFAGDIKVSITDLERTLIRWPYTPTVLWGIQRSLKCFYPCERSLGSW